MHWQEAVDEQLKRLKPIDVNDALFSKLFQLIDLTRLVDNDNENNLALFFEKAETSLGHVAAVCVYPQYVSLAAAQFVGKPIKIATVVNFPSGNSTLETVLIEINRALRDGAQEIDMVFPYLRYLAGEKHDVQQFVEACKAACGDNVCLKVILETGALLDTDIIADASWDVMLAGADFIKTSTGKIATGATLEAVATILLVMQHAKTRIKKPIGIKVSGGIKTITQVAQYIELSNHIMGQDWVNGSTFRIGASQLVDEILSHL